ncbi:Aste57867_23587 [Aphanomyces stellatus]|uniref:Aste57867_23587 protein n=1 Tax=Aphanomyces stellatus TaxID=120398 RepID=A0A485LN21_9STRA|nr:hypothetical protein As57867_023515 [Aphanomyces stellatus]VFU00232.1 Aste57867_23587 [Aphanomyces stellatus]
MDDGSVPSLAPEEIAAHAPLTAIRVLLALISYFLFVTDVPRSGYGFKTIPFPLVSTNQYSLYGPSNYRVAQISRNKTTGTFGGLDGKGGPLSTVDLWLYKFDTTSVSMRSTMQYFAPNIWDPCLAYKQTCASSTLDLKTVFTMLDTLVSLTAAHSRTLTLRVESFFVDKLHDVLAPRIFNIKYWQTIQVNVFNNPAQASVCQAKMTAQPSFCQLPWHNYVHLGGSPTNVVLVADFIQAKAKAYSLLPNQTVQLLLLENIVGNLPDTSGVVDTAVRKFDIVAIFRVQTCDPGGLCITDTVEDYRFEGGILTTNTVAWYRTLRLLRFLGQMYNLLRVLALLWGCYALLRTNATFTRVSTLAKLVQVLKLGLRILCQVVVYGSWFPVALFVAAHVIDCPMVYQYSASKWRTILGVVNFTPVDVMTIAACHMRNVWLLSLVSKIHLLSYPIHSFATHGVPGARGYALISASFLSVFLSIRIRSIRSTELLQVIPVPPGPHLPLLHVTSNISSQSSPGGLWLDLKTLLISVTLVLIALRIKFKHVLYVPTFVPHGALVFGSPLLFSTSWFGSLLDTDAIDGSKVGVVLSVRRGQSVVTLLMNLAWMTDPMTFAMALWKNPMVHMYEHTTTKETFLHPLPLKLMASWKNEDAETFRLIGKYRFMGLPWTDRLLVE